MLDNWLPFLIYGLLRAGDPGLDDRIVVPLRAPGRAGAARARAPFRVGRLAPGRRQQKRFTVSFYLTAMLFIVFDIEIVFLYPLAADARAARLVRRSSSSSSSSASSRSPTSTSGGRERSSGDRATKRKRLRDFGLQCERLLWPTKGPARSSRRSARQLEQRLVLTTLEKAVAWAQTNSMWPDTFGLACCAIEMMSIVSSRYDIARFGMEAFRSSPRQADLLIVSGRVSHKMAAPLRQIYDQMLEPKWVIAMGACASSGGMFNNYAMLQGVDKIVPVDIYVPGCPPRPEVLMEGIIRLHEAVQRRRPARVRGAGGGLVSYAACPASSRSGPPTARRPSSSSPASCSRPAAAARRGGLQLPLRHHRDRLPRLGRAAARRGLHRHAAGRDLNAQGSQGLAAAAGAEAEAVLDELPPARARRRRAPRCA